MEYSEGLKKAMVEKLLLPDSIGITALSRESGIPRRTLFDWRKKYCSDKGCDINIKSRSGRPQDWPLSQKFEAVLESASLKDVELGKWLRMEGLHSEHLEIWKEEIKDMTKDNKKNEEFKNAKKRIKELEKDLRLKEKALAEASALLLLKKKADAILGKDEED